MLDREINEILANSPLFAGVPAEQIDEVLCAEQACVRRYARNEFIFLEGDVPRKLYILISGNVHVATDTVSGRRIVVTEICEPGEMFGEVYLFRAIRFYDIHAQAAADSRILELSGELFDGDNQILMKNLLNIFAQKAYRLGSMVRILGGSSLRERIVRFVYESIRNSGVPVGSREAVVRIKREDMADFLHVARPSLSRELGKMQDEGILTVRGREISVCDREAFEEYL